jgi:hypothetical protein
MQADGLFAQRPAPACHSQRSTLGDQSSQDRYQIVQPAGEMRLCSGAQAGSIASKSGDGAAVVDVVAVGLSGKASVCRDSLFYDRELDPHQ